MIISSRGAPVLSHSVHSLAPFSRVRHIYLWRQYIKEAEPQFFLRCLVRFYTGLLAAGLHCTLFIFFFPLHLTGRRRSDSAWMVDVPCLRSLHVPFGALSRGACAAHVLPRECPLFSPPFLPSSTAVITFTEGWRTPYVIRSLCFGLVLGGRLHTCWPFAFALSFYHHIQGGKDG